MDIKTRYDVKGKRIHPLLVSPVVIPVSKARYDSKGHRRDNPYTSPEFNPLVCTDGVTRAYRGKLVVLPNGSYEMSVTRPDTKLLDAMGAAIRPCDLLPKSRTDEEQAERDEENKKRACRMARQKIRHLVKCIGGDHLCTNTYRETMQDMDKLKRDFQEFVRLVRIKYPEWIYVAVFEKQRSDQPDWSYHLHIAVAGKQDIRWLLRCWLRAIGQPLSEVDDWYIRGVKLAEKSFGAVNVKGPDRKYGGKGVQWKADRLSSYLTKYISKEFESASKHAKKYWHPKGIEKPEVIKFWLGATNFPEAIREAHDMLYFRGVDSFDRMFGSMDLGIIWLSASTERKTRHLVTSSPCPDLLAD